VLEEGSADRRISVFKTSQLGLVLVPRRGAVHIMFVAESITTADSLVQSGDAILQNTCIPCLHGVVASLEGGSRLTGAFAPHPFQKILVLLPWVILVPILL
jgi:hypothetical protein